MNFRVAYVVLAGSVLSFMGASALAAEPAARSKLAWAPPQLKNPVIINISNTNRSPKLDKTKDYIIKMPDTPLTAPGGLVISGGHHVVLIGGEIRFDHMPEDPKKSLEARGIYINGATGTVHIEGLWITGEGLKEGFNIDLRAPEAILQLQNIRVDTVHGSREGHHADVVQTWAGPPVLRIDRLTGRTTYQGFFLHPTQHVKEPFPKPLVFDLRHINIRSVESGGYIYWQSTPFTLTTQDVWAEPLDGRWPNLVLWPKGDPVWKDVKKGTPPDGDFVPEGVAGLSYVSPGYEE